MFRRRIRGRPSFGWCSGRGSLCIRLGFFFCRRLRLVAWPLFFLSRQHSLAECHGFLWCRKTARRLTVCRLTKITTGLRFDRMPATDRKTRWLGDNGRMRVLGCRFFLCKHAPLLLWRHAITKTFRNRRKRTVLQAARAQLIYQLVNWQIAIHGIDHATLGDSFRFRVAVDRLVVLILAQRRFFLRRWLRLNRLLWRGAFLRLRRSRLSLYPIL